MNKFIPHHLHSTYSILDGIIKPDKLAKRCKELNYTHAMITDHGNLSGYIKFATAMKKQGIIPCLGCLLPNQEIITDNGAVNIEDIKPFDNVLTHKGRFKKVLMTSISKYSGKIYHIYLTGVKKPISITSEHPVLIRDNNNKISWNKAEDIVFGYINQKLPLDKKHKSYVCLPRLNQNNNILNIEKYLPDHLGIINGCVQKIRKKHKNDSNFSNWSNIKGEIEICNDFAYFLGLFCAEGSFGSKKGLINGDIRLTFNIKEEEYVYFCLKFLKDKFNINASVYIRPERSVSEIAFCCSPLAYVLSEICGRSCYNKKIPKEIFNADRNIKESFCKGLLDGDGKKANQQTLKVSSKSLCHQYRILMSDVKGEFLSTREVNYSDNPYYITDYTKGEYCSFKKSFGDDLYVYKPIKKVEIEEVNNINVYNCQVEDDNSYVSACILHNCEFYLCHQDPTIQNADNKSLFHMVVCAKNKDSFSKLVKAVSESNKKENFYYKPRLNHEKLADIIGDSCWIFSGHPGSYLWDFKTEEEIITGINYLKGLFGDNLCLELQRFMRDPEVDSHIELLKSAGEKTNTLAKACIDAHYVNREDVDLHRIVLCSNLHKTIPQINKMKSEDKPMGVFFEKDYFYVPSIEELKSYGHTDEELDMSFITDNVETFDIQEQPRLPKFTDNEEEYFTEQCRIGFRNKKKVNWGNEYVERVKYELGVLNKANLAGYFLIVADYINWAKKRGILVGPARGSSLGSLVCYLLNITSLDPIPYNLDFERFYNNSRNTLECITFKEFSYEEFKKQQKL